MIFAGTQEPTPATMPKAGSPKPDRISNKQKAPTSSSRRLPLQATTGNKDLRKLANTGLKVSKPKPRRVGWFIRPLATTVAKQPATKSKAAPSPSTDKRVARAGVPRRARTKSDVPLDPLDRVVYPGARGGRDREESTPRKFTQFKKARALVINTPSITTPPAASKLLRKMARRPHGRVLADQVDYEHESDTERDDRDGDEDEDDEMDEEERAEMARFIDDDDEDGGGYCYSLHNRRRTMAVPFTSTGPCFEDAQGRSSASAAMDKYRLQIMNPAACRREDVDLTTIDPWSTAYWARAKRPATTTTATGGLVPAHMIDAFRSHVVSEDLRDLTKAAMVDMLRHRLGSSACTKIQIRKTLEAVAARTAVPGRSKREKRWCLL